MLGYVVIKVNKLETVFGLRLFAAIWNIAERGEKMSDHFFFGKIPKVVC